MQSDQIGLIFTYWAIVYSGQFLFNFRRSPNYFSTVISCCVFNFDKKIGGATFWAIFSQTYLVTLVP
jgi:hypothetical protein